MPKKKQNAKARKSKQLKYQELLPALKDFAEQIKGKFSLDVKGEPENQIRNPVENLFRDFAEIITREITLKGESSLNRLGKPDFAVISGKLLVGYIELKAPGKGANPSNYKGHDREQWKRFKNIPNIIYTDGNEWGLYRSGQLEGKRVQFSGDIITDGKKAISSSNARALFYLFAEFLSWTPIVPEDPKDLAAFLAPFCLLIREDVLEALKDSDSPICSLRDDIKKLLFPEADDRRFADTYAQTVIFALLLAHMEKADVLDLRSAYNVLESGHLLLSRSLEFLTDRTVLKEISSSLSLAQRVIHEIFPETMRSTPEKQDPWLFFYEHFLAEYDPKLRKEWGVYYTPVEVVNFQVRMIDEILANHLGKGMGFVEPGVITLDPALGTGTYLLGIIEHALKRVAKEEGPGSVVPSSRMLMQNLYGFEWMVGPYAVAQLRFERALTARGATIPPEGLGIYLTNTLESPHTTPPEHPLFFKPMAKEHEKALKIKDAEHVLVCLGNPPYGRHEAATEENRAVTGGWVRHGHPQEPGMPILEAFIEPARKAGHGVDIKNLYNLYIYFIRWALWKVFEHKSATGPGIVSFITASSYLDGDAFAGVREHMRKVCDHIDIIDLGGEGRGTRKDENIFKIKTPVAIFIAWRKAKANTDKPAIVRYTRIKGTREVKLKALAKIRKSKNISWQKVTSGWQDKFLPSALGGFKTWPLITDIFPWQHSGAQFKRLWPIAPDEETLKRRWITFVKSGDRIKFFRETRDRKINKSYPNLLGGQKLTPLIDAKEADMHSPVPYGYRSFDRQFILPDNRLGDFLRPSIWQAHSDKQIYLSSLFNHPLGKGPAVTVCAHIPDLHHFRGSYGAKEVIPLYRDSSATEENVLPDLLKLLSAQYKSEVSHKDLLAYVYTMLAQPEYTNRFYDELEGREVRVPLTKEKRLFFQVAEFGKELIWLHTYGERMTSKGRRKGNFPKGKAKCLKAVSGKEEKYPNEFSYDEISKTLFVGDGQFGPVGKEVYEFEVSGLQVVKSWLGYRMRERAGKKSSPLDDIRPKTWTRQFTRELLEILWVLEITIKGYPKQKKLLEKVLDGELFTADELPDVPKEARKPPKVKRPRKKGQQDLNF